MTNSFDVNENSDIYYCGNTYWNDLEPVRRRINQRISGNPSVKWFEHFAHETGRTFKNALILNCGNGWVERELVQYGLISAGVGIDYSQPLLDEATSVAREGGLPLAYYQANTNTGEFPPVEFDLVVNHAAAHHIASIDRVLREVCRILPEDGWFVSFDYVGAHRLQYRLDAWEEAWTLNLRLPDAFRQEMLYPPMPVALVVDPTEAIHSELILETFHRYFSVGQLTPLGGAVAYPLLTHNARLFDAADDVERTKWIDWIMDADDGFLGRHPESTLFAYFAGQPKKSVLQQVDALREWEEEEEQRERRAQENGGEYYERTPLSIVLVAIDEQRALNAGTRDRIAHLQSELRAMRARFMYSRARRIIDSRWIRAARSALTDHVTTESVKDGAVGSAQSEAEASEPAVSGALSTARHRLGAERRDYARLSDQVEAVQAEITALESERLYSVLQRITDAEATHRLRSNRLVAALEQRARAARGRRST